MRATAQNVQGVLLIVLGVVIIAIFWGFIVLKIAAGIGGLIAINYGRKLLSLPPMWEPLRAWYYTVKEWLELT